jgi:hypothetical protein
MTATSHHFKDIVPPPAQNWNQMVPAVFIEESHENRNVFIGALSLGKNFGDRHQWLAGTNPTLQECASFPLQSGKSGIIWNHWKVTTQSRHAIHIRLSAPRIES